MKIAAAEHQFLLLVLLFTGTYLIGADSFANSSRQSKQI